MFLLSPQLEQIRSWLSSDDKPAGDLLAEDDGRSAFSDKVEENRPKVAFVTGPCAFPGC